MTSKLQRSWPDWLLWAIMAIPGVLMLTGLARGQADAMDLLHPSGEFSARLMIVAMMIGPLFDLWGRSAFTQWMMQHRRHFGVAAFAYAALHLWLYLLDMEWSITDMLAELDAPGIWTGWIALFVMLLPALASNNAAMRLLKRNWKRIQQLAYFVAILTLAHWIFLTDEFGPALVHFVPLLALNIARWGKHLKGRTAS